MDAATKSRDWLPYADEDLLPALRATACFESGMTGMLPTECRMPDLAGLLASPLDRSFLMNQLVGSEARFPEKMLIYRRNFLRLADKVVRDYSDARNGVLSIIEKQKARTLDIPEGRAMMNIITNKLEDCIISLRRLFDYFDRIKSNTPGFPIDRLVKRRVETLNDAIMDMRDLIIHMDKDISGSVVEFGDPISPELNPTCDVVSIGKHTLPVEWLTRAIQLFHDFAREFTRYEWRADGSYRPTPQSGPLKR
ncbi:hypothetical protein ACVWXM_002529 [Bradyrhizobium sp. GM7.3]